MWWLVAIYAAMLILEYAFKMKEIPLLLPYAVAALGIALFRKELKAVDFNIVKESSYWYAVYQALVVGLIVQAIGIVVIKYGFGIPSPSLAFAIPLAAPLVSVLISSPLEEIVFRGILFPFLDRRIGFWGAAIVSSALFGVAHYDYAAWLGYFVLGIVWCRVYKKTGNLLIPIGAHMVFNTLIFMVRSF
jgi:membrane protease YdiL (CAAX protease family)